MNNTEVNKDINFTNVSHFMEWLKDDANFTRYNMLRYIRNNMHDIPFGDFIEICRQLTIKYNRLKISKYDLRDILEEIKRFRKDTSLIIDILARQCGLKPL